MGPKPKSVLWDFFVINEPLVDKSKVRCAFPDCGLILSRGSNVKNFSTTPLANHLVLRL